MIAAGVVLGVVAIASGALVFVVDSMARATYALLASFLAVALLLLAVGLVYLAPITVLMMTMEMAVMAVFMVMFMGMNPALMAMDMARAKRSSALVAVLVFGGLAAAVLLIPWPAQAPRPAGDQVAALGAALMSGKSLVMLTVGPVLLATIVSALVLANPGGRYGRRDRHEPGPAGDRGRR